jgi:hypothetical protein
MSEPTGSESEDSPVVVEMRQRLRRLTLTPGVAEDTAMLALRLSGARDGRENVEDDGTADQTVSPNLTAPTTENENTQEPQGDEDADEGGDGGAAQEEPPAEDNLNYYYPLDPDLCQEDYREIRDNHCLYCEGEKEEEFNQTFPSEPNPSIGVEKRQTLNRLCRKWAKSCTEDRGKERQLPPIDWDESSRGSSNRRVWYVRVYRSGGEVVVARQAPRITRAAWLALPKTRPVRGDLSDHEPEPLTDDDGDKGEEKGTSKITSIITTSARRTGATSA